MTIAVFLLIYFIRSDSRWLYPTLVATAAILSCRVISLIVDGFALVPFYIALFESVAIIACVLLIRFFPTQED